MFKRKSHDHDHAAEAKTPPQDAPQEITQVLGPADRFRREAEEHAERVERMRIEHIAAERGVTVAELLAAPLAPVEESLSDPHIKESMRASDKAAHIR